MLASIHHNQLCRRKHRDFRIYATLLLTSALCHRIRGIESTIGSASLTLDSTRVSRSKARGELF